VLVVLLSAMVALTFTDVLGRRLFNTPVFGANDITEHLMALIIFSGLPLLTARRGHFSIDLFDHWLLRPKWRALAQGGGRADRSRAGPDRLASTFSPFGCAQHQ
jgi:TRAP-type C4-dicarboxylate transport system permease small subunit